jgi:sterol desaturase/sphingolipid hydroxylase (fatty acid hydroxylase superfamily)
MTLALDALNQTLLTLWHVLPWLAGLGVAFALLCRLSPCNAGKPWWKKQGLVTDLSYWIFVPIFSRYLRIWLTVCLTIWLFHINDGQKISDFYAHGHGPLSRLPLWAQGLFYLVVSDLVLYWIHRGFHTGGLWKYHAIHHAPEELDWISAARFHPVNLMLGTIAVDVVALLGGISPDIFLIVGPFNTVSSCLVHANLNWTFGPLRYVFASPVFHRWHHAASAYNTNFAGTFSLWDVMFATFYMPKAVLPDSYGISDKAMPEGLFAQMVYPLLQEDRAGDADGAGAQHAA